MSKWCLNDVYLMFESWFMHDDWCRCCCDCDNFVVVVNWCASAKMMFLLFLCCLNNVSVMSEWCLHEVWIMIGLCRNDVWSMFGWRLAVILMLLSFLCCCFYFKRSILCVLVLEIIWRYSEKYVFFWQHNFVTIFGWFFSHYAFWHAKLFFFQIDVLLLLVLSFFIRLRVD